jgi:hypothetical protein
VDTNALEDEFLLKTIMASEVTALSRCRMAAGASTFTKRALLGVFMRAARGAA